jgi:uncharacterized damage-inducible protein DinB
MPMRSRYVMFAAYNRWANERLHDAAARLSDGDYRADRGAFFKSVHGTLNHLLSNPLHLLRTHLKLRARSLMESVV